MTVNSLAETGDRTTREQLLRHLDAEFNKPFTSWDCSYLRGRIVEQSSTLPWDYEETVRGLLSQSQGLLDMGTGDGEFLAALSPLPKDTCATEGWAPNIPIARRKLKPLGVTVTAITEKDIRLPLNDARFDLIINRHGTYTPFEVHRLLKPGGIFVTQQIGEKDNVELNALLGVTDMFKTHRNWNLEVATLELQKAGFRVIEMNEAFLETKFHDVGAVVLYLKAHPCQIEEFSVEKYSEQLVALHKRIQENESVSFQSHRFFIMATKP
ncbi:10437_t:CDS:2 [Paraglomus occultum]|uniref:10437_t:CDS:1 n=1 Tax=Paraglomus occultum TaxID=144539 RepID=A0A9N9A376_9GLOM|nr:10437_t:CDS:2 [Paraglomus occultum]